jgi:catechol 2,3-dioxygenase-like lactoylglutathione lyase family enzyme
MNQVRLVSDLQMSKEFYKSVLGCKVDEWGHAERNIPKLGFILQQAEFSTDVQPNKKPRQVKYPKDWKGPTTSWDTYAYTDYDKIEDLFNELKTNGAIIHYEIMMEDQGDMDWKEFAVRDLDQYVIVFGAGRMK